MKNVFVIALLGWLSAAAVAADGVGASVRGEFWTEMSNFVQKCDSPMMDIFSTRMVYQSFPSAKRIYALGDEVLPLFREVGSRFPDMGKQGKEYVDLLYGWKLCCGAYGDGNLCPLSIGYTSRVMGKGVKFALQRMKDANAAGDVVTYELARRAIARYGCLAFEWLVTEICDGDEEALDIFRLFKSRGDDWPEMNREAIASWWSVNGWKYHLLPGDVDPEDAELERRWKDIVNSPRYCEAVMDLIYEEFVKGYEKWRETGDDEIVRRFGYKIVRPLTRMCLTSDRAEDRALLLRLLKFDTDCAKNPWGAASVREIGGKNGSALDGRVGDIAEEYVAAVKEGNEAKREHAERAMIAQGALALVPLCRWVRACGKDEYVPLAVKAIAAIDGSVLSDRCSLMKWEGSERWRAFYYVWHDFIESCADVQDPEKSGVNGNPTVR